MEVNFLIILPFVLLLLSIAVFPFVCPKWWNKNYSFISVGLALIVAVYYLLVSRPAAVLVSIEEYVMFISFVGSLYVVSGGILIESEGFATPGRNVMLLAAGALLANFVGTIGASIILIRPYIRTNRIRFSSYHIVFFIFIVSNAGGLLTPIGNPPLLLGFLKGIPFLWIGQKSIFIWLIVVGALLAVFYFLDTGNFRKQPESIREKDEETGERLLFSGWLSSAMMVVIIASVFLTKPLFLREAIMIAASYISYKFTNKKIHSVNKFSFHPIKEVAWLFFGIFVTMSPALEALAQRSKDIALDSPSQFYWYTGFMSSILDNAPTYLAFFTTSMGSFGLDFNSSNDVLIFITSHQAHAVAISISSVLFGAATYIGNAPNFIVKSIVENQGIKTPSFFGYILKYSIPIMIPLYFLIWWLFIV